MMDPGLETVFSRLTSVMRDVFDDDDLIAEPGMTADDVEAWDSLSNIRLIMAVERTFGISFTTPEIAALENVGQLAALIGRKVQTGASAGSA